MKSKAENSHNPIHHLNIKTMQAIVTNTLFRIPGILCLSLLLLLGFGAQRARAAIAVVDSTGGIVTNNVTTVSVPFSTTGGNVLVVNFQFRGTNNSYPLGLPPVPLEWVVGGNTQSLTRAVSQSFSNTARAFSSSVYYLNNPNVGAGTIQGSFPSSNPQQGVSAFTLSGVDINVAPIVASAVSLTDASIITNSISTNVPAGGFAALAACNRFNGGTAIGFGVIPPSGSVNNWLTVVGASGWAQGYFSGLGSGDQQFTCTFGQVAGMQIVAAVFTPAAVISAQPVVDFPTKSGITTTAATLGATVITNSGSTIDDYGVVYSATSVNASPTVGGSGVTKVVKGTVQTYGAFTTNVTGLTPGTQYSYAGYAHNAAGYGYSSVDTFYALVNEPTVQASGVSISSAQRSAFTISWTRGNGANCIVVVKAGSAVDSAPVDGTTYTANTAFGLGTQIGAGNHVVYVGSGNAVTLSGLTIGTTYYVSVYEVNGTGGSENYLTTSPATGSAAAVPNTYYSFGNNAPTSVAVWWTGTGGTGNNPADFTGGDIFIIQNGHTYATGGANWTLSGGAKLIINSGGTLDMTTDKLFLGGSFVNNGTFLATGATAPTVNFVNFGNVNLSTNYSSTLTVGTNYNVSVLAIGGGGGGAGVTGTSTPLTQGGGGGGGASAYSTGLVLQGGLPYQVTVGANGIRGTAGTLGNPGTEGGASSFGGGFVTAIVANGGGGGQSGGTGGAGGAAGSSGNAANFAGGSAVSGGGGGGGGADDVAAGNAAGSGSGGTPGSGSLATGGAGGTIAANASGTAGTAPGGGGSGANWTSGAGKGGSAGGVGWVVVQLISTNTSPSTLTYDYRSRASGSWSDFNTWSVDKGSGFVNAISGETPNSGHNSVVVSNTHTVTVSSASVAVNLTVNTGAVLTVNGGGLSVNRLPGQIVANNLTVNGTLNLATANALSLGNNTTNLIAAGAVLNDTALGSVVQGTGVQTTINGTYNQNVTGSGVIPLATWGPASACQINSTFTSNIDVGGNDVQLNYGQAFANFIWNAQGGTTNVVYRMTESTIANWTVGNLTISNTAGTPARLELASAASVIASAQSITMNGGNFKAGSGGLDLTVSGSIAINAGLFDTGGSIKVGGSITVASGSTISGSGQIGATSVTLATGAFAANDLGNNLSLNSWTNTALIVTNSLVLNGNTFNVNTGTNVLAAGNYVLITNASGGITGPFASSPVISGAGLGVGLTGTVVTTANLVTLQVASAVTAPPVITSIVKSGSDLIISGTNTTGTAGGTYYVRATNVVTAPIAGWPRISTNTYGVGGAFSVTNQILPGVPVNFYRIEQ